MRCVRLRLESEMSLTPVRQQQRSCLRTHESKSTRSTTSLLLTCVWRSFRVFLAVLRTPSLDFLAVLLRTLFWGLRGALTGRCREWDSFRARVGQLDRVRSTIRLLSRLSPVPTRGLDLTPG